MNLKTLNSDGGWGNSRIERELDSLREQIRELKENSVKDTQSLSEQFKELNAFVFQNVPPVVNYIDNGDFVFEQEDYEAGTNYANDHLDCAKWYQRAASSSGQVTEHTTTVQSADGINTTTSNAFYWDKTSGELVLGNAAALFAPLPKNVAFPATTLFCRLQIKKFSGAITIPDTWRLRASIWDNTAGQQKIIEGAVFDISAVPANAAPGTITRQYILRVDTNMDFFFSDVLTPVSVANQVSVSGTDNTNFVTVSWQVFPESVRYRLYRHDSEFNEWRLIADILNGATSFRDVGGRSGELFNLPVANILPRAQALFVNFGEYISTDYKDVIFTIFVPSNYNYALTTNKQWLRVDMVDKDLNFVTMPDDAIRIDKISLGVTNGRFTYSARDIAAAATVSATTPPPVPPPGGDDGDGGGTTPPKGEGGSPKGCVTPDTLVLVSVDDVWGWIPASNVEVGDYVVNASKQTSKVVDIFRGKSTCIYTIITSNGKQINCSPGHKVITSLGDKSGTPAHKLKLGDLVLTINHGEIEQSTVSAIEILQTPIGADIITFQLEGERNYLAGGIASHNLKALII